MWLAISSIVLAFAIGLDVLALLLTGWLERHQPKAPLIQSGTRTLTYPPVGHRVNRSRRSAYEATSA